MDEQDHSAAADSFRSYYSKFVGDPMNPNAADSATAELVWQTPSPKSQLSPLNRNSLMGAGSLLATLAVGFLLTDGARSQLPSNAQAAAPEPQSDTNVSNRLLPSPSSALLPVPTSPEPIEVQRSATARRPLREMLAERLQKLQAADEARLKQEQTQMRQGAIANRNQDINRRLQLRAQAQQQAALAAANTASAPTSAPETITAQSTYLSATSDNAATAEATAASPQSQQGTSTPILSASSASSAPSSDAIARRSGSEVNPANHTERMELDQTVAIQGYDLSVLNPNMLEFPNQPRPTETAHGAQGSSASEQASPVEQQTAAADSVPSRAAATNQPHRPTVNSLQGHGIHDYLELPQRVSEGDRPTVLPLSPRAAAEVSNVDYLNQFLVFHVSPAEYQKLWGAKRFSTLSKTAPTYGVIDYQRRMVIVPQATTVARDAATPAADVQ